MCYKELSNVVPSLTQNKNTDRKIFILPISVSTNTFRILFLIKSTFISSKKSITLNQRKILQRIHYLFMWTENNTRGITLNLMQHYAHLNSIFGITGQLTVESDRKLGLSLVILSKNV